LPHWKRSTDEEDAKYSDWTLDVTFINDNDNDNDNNNNASDANVSYSVHKYILGLQSEYFEGIFRGPPDDDDDDKENGFFSESYQKRSSIKLPAARNVVTIDHFENVLDYLYTGKLELDCDNAVAIVYFGDYFGIHLLKEHAQNFIQKSISVATLSAFKFNPSIASSRILAKFFQDELRVYLVFVLELV